MSNCKTCNHLRPVISDRGNATSRWYCEIARTECLPKREVARAKGNEIPIKTSPRWCPLKELEDE